MSRPRLDPAELQAVLGAARVPRTHTIEGRVSLIAEAAKQLFDSGTQAGAFVGGMLQRWLEDGVQKGGSLERDYFAVVIPKSRRTASVIYREQNPHPDVRADMDDWITSGSLSDEGEDKREN